jgi:hypothetical protein
MPPSRSHPVNCADSQRFSRPLRQYAHCPQVNPSHGIPTRRPSATLVATIWWPRTRGGEATVTSPSSRCRSVRQMPQAWTRSSSSPSSGSGIGRSRSVNGCPTPSKTIARIDPSEPRRDPNKLRGSGLCTVGPLPRLTVRRRAGGAQNTSRAAVQGHAAMTIRAADPKSNGRSRLAPSTPGPRGRACLRRAENAG